MNCEFAVDDFMVASKVGGEGTTYLSMGLLMGFLKS